LGGATAFAAFAAVVGARFDLSRTRRVLVMGVVGGAAALLLMACAASHRGWDWTEQRRGSLPPGAVSGLRALRQPLTIDVFLDRDDSRRRQLESDVIAKLYLARPDLVVHMPLDGASDVTEGQRDGDYGKITIHAGTAMQETRSTSRRELVSLIFDAAGLPMPSWSQPPYPGYPFVADGRRRMVLAGLAYVVIPLALLVTGLALTRRRFAR
jgi:hypothetical protein